MSKSITNLIKEPTGTNPLVNKLTDIIFSTKIDLGDFIDGLEFKEKETDEDLLKKLIMNI